LRRPPLLQRAIGSSRDRHEEGRGQFAGKVLNMIAAGELAPAEAAEVGKLIENYVRTIETRH
jgi:hypothetical protein